MIVGPPGKIALRKLSTIKKLVYFRFPPVVTLDQYEMIITI